MEKKFAVGDIVTVHFEELEFLNSPFQGKQGEIVEINSDHQDGPIGVRFPGWYMISDRMFFDFLNFIAKDDPETFFRTGIHFEERELKNDENWLRPKIPVDNLCNILFGRSMWHILKILKHPFVPGYYDCQYQGCGKKATLQIFVNILGVVHNIFVCSDHSSHHGKNCEDFPFKEQMVE